MKKILLLIALIVLTLQAESFAQLSTPKIKVKDSVSTDKTATIQVPYKVKNTDGSINIMPWATNAGSDYVEVSRFTLADLDESPIASEYSIFMLNGTPTLRMGNTNFPLISPMVYGGCNISSGIRTAFGLTAAAVQNTFMSNTLSKPLFLRTDSSSEASVLRDSALTSYDIESASPWLTDNHLQLVHVVCGTPDEAWTANSPLASIFSAGATTATPFIIKEGGASPDYILAQVVLSNETGKGYSTKIDINTGTTPLSSIDIYFTIMINSYSGTANQRSVAGVLFGPPEDESTGGWAVGFGLSGFGFMPNKSATDLWYKGYGTAAYALSTPVAINDAPQTFKLSIDDDGSWLLYHNSSGTWSQVETSATHSNPFTAFNVLDTETETSGYGDGTGNYVYRVSIEAGMYSLAAATATFGSRIYDIAIFARY